MLLGVAWIPILTLSLLIEDGGRYQYGGVLGNKITRYILASPSGTLRSFVSDRQRYFL